MDCMSLSKLATSLESSVEVYEDKSVTSVLNVSIVLNVKEDKSLISEAVFPSILAIAVERLA